MKSIEEQTREAAAHFDNNNFFTNSALYDGFIAGAEWERSRNKWISVKDDLPSPLSPVNFVVDLPGSWRHGHVYGGVFTGGNDKNEFSTPGWAVKASHWMPAPEPPKQKKD